MKITTKKITCTNKNIFTEEKVPEFIESLRDNNLTLILLLTTKIIQIEVVTDFLRKNANKVFGKRINIISNYNNKTHLTDKPKWIDKKCYTAKPIFKGSKYIFACNKTDTNRLIFT